MVVAVHRQNFSVDESVVIVVGHLQKLSVDEVVVAVEVVPEQGVVAAVVP